MKIAVAVAVCTAVVVGAASSASAVSYTYLCVKDNANYNYTDETTWNWGGASQPRAAKGKQEGTYYCAWSAAQRTDLASKMAVALPQYFAWQVTFRISTGPSDPHGGALFTPSIGAFFSLTDWAEGTGASSGTIGGACNDYADTGVPWMRDDTSEVVTFWGLRDIASSKPVVGGWQTPATYSPAITYSWNYAVLDSAVVTVLSTDPNCRGLRMWDATGNMYNDHCCALEQWSGHSGIGAGTLILQDAYIGIPGDADLNRIVEFKDYQALEQNFGLTTGTTWAQGDFDRDGKVEFDDYQILEQHFGQSVPEPGTLTVICGAAVGLLLKRRRNA